MAETKKAPAKKDPVEAIASSKNAELEFEDGYWWIVSGTKRLNVGRSQRHAQRIFAETYPK